MRRVVPAFLAGRPRLFWSWPTPTMIAYLVPALLSLAAGPEAKCAPPPANWEQTPGPCRSGINALIQNGAITYAGTVSDGVFRSTDGGVTWSAANSGIGGSAILALAGAGSVLYAAEQSDDLGYGGVFHSTDAGLTWSPFLSGLENRYIMSLDAKGDNAYAGDAGNGVYKSTDHGLTWLLSNDGMGNESVAAIATSGANLFALGSNFTYRSTDAGIHWNYVHPLDYFNFFSLGTSGTSIFAGGWVGLSRSLDGGVNWDHVEIPFPQFVRVAALAADGANVFAGTDGSPAVGVYKSTDSGTTWSAANGNIELVPVTSLVLNGGRLLAGSVKKSLVTSTDGGVSWSQITAGLPPGGEIRRILTDGSVVLAATGGDGVYRSTDHGGSWTKSDSDPSNALRNELVFSLCKHSGFFFAATSTSGVYRSSNGVQWARVNSGLPQSGLFVFDLSAIGPTLMAGTSAGIFRSTDEGANWVSTTVGVQTQALASGGGFAYALVETGLGDSSGLYRSSNGGQSWVLIWPHGFSTPISLAADGNSVYIGDLLDGMIRSDNNGLSWIDASPSAGVGVFSILPAIGALYAGTQSSGQQVYKSTDFGRNWTAYNQGLVAGEAGEALAIDASALYVGTDRHGVWRRLQIDPTGVPEGARISADRLEQNSPNPFSGRTTIRFRVPESEHVRLRVFDPAGRERAVLVDQVLPAGDHTIDLEASRLDPGVYFYKLEGRGFSESRRMTVLR